MWTLHNNCKVCSPLSAGSPPEADAAVATAVVDEFRVVEDETASAPSSSWLALSDMTFLVHLEAELVRETRSIKSVTSLHHS